MKQLNGQHIATITVVAAFDLTENEVNQYLSTPDDRRPAVFEDIIAGKPIVTGSTHYSSENIKRGISEALVQWKERELKMLAAPQPE
jgi:hypothetical protein